MSKTTRTAKPTAKPRRAAAREAAPPIDQARIDEAVRRFVAIETFAIQAHRRLDAGEICCQEQVMQLIFDHPDGPAEEAYAQLAAVMGPASADLFGGDGDVLFRTAVSYEHGIQLIETLDSDGEPTREVRGIRLRDVGPDALGGPRARRLDPVGVN